jgi:hypothetical protein
MSTQAASELRLRMIEDMKARQLGVHTRAAATFTAVSALPPI